MLTKMSMTIGALASIAILTSMYMLKDLGAEPGTGSEHLKPVVDCFWAQTATDVDGNTYKFKDLHEKQAKAVLIFNSASA